MNQETQTLIQLLTQENNLATSLLELMLEEKNILEANSPDKLTVITKTKAECLDNLEAVSRKRAQLLLTLSNAQTAAGRMTQFISEQTPKLKASLTQSVDKLEDSLEKCRHQNSINGMIISMSQRNVQRNLNIIKGIDHESMTYTQKGTTTSIGNKHGGMKV